MIRKIEYMMTVLLCYELCDGEVIQKCFGLNKIRNYQTRDYYYDYSRREKVVHVDISCGNEFIHLGNIVYSISRYDNYLCRMPNCTYYGIQQYSRCDCCNSRFDPAYECQISFTDQLHQQKESCERKRQCKVTMDIVDLSSYCSKHLRYKCDRELCNSQWVDVYYECLPGKTLPATATSTTITTTQNTATPWLTIESTNEVSMASVASDKNKEMIGKGEEPDQEQLIPVIVLSVGICFLLVLCGLLVGIFCTRYNKLQRRFDQMLQQTSYEIKAEDEDSFQPPMLIEERKPTPEKHNNKNTGNTSSAGHSANDSQNYGGSTNETTYQNISQGTAAQGAAYTDVQSILKAKNRGKDHWTDPGKKEPQGKKKEENHQNGMNESEYETAKDVTQALGDIEMVENTYYVSG